MEEKTGFLEASPKNKSNSRLTGNIIIYVALCLAAFVLISGMFIMEKPNPLTLATASGVLFLTIAGPALAFMFGQKLNEVKKKVE